ncbi:MAG: SusC/RagA family TonB-linked outer membrane protein [Chryseobacterium sp.]|nr:MAG: SusC/RagA family TonB-linked outer membrane protein [Chryseobacterium sp.]
MRIRLAYACLLALIVLSLSSKVLAQQVKGKVIDFYSKRPISATLLVKETGFKLQTDSMGRFVMKLENGKHHIRFSHIGYNVVDTLITVPLAGEFFVEMLPATQMLTEVQVSTGYQTLNRERSTGSFSVVNNAMLQQQVGTNIMDRLEGVASSVSIDRSTNGGGLMVRGLSTLRGLREPLIILDNFPYEGSLDNINPNDIEDITILKDAAAASIWGARAGNGVIVLRSKSFKKKDGVEVALNINSTLGIQPDLFQLPQITTASFIEVERFLFGKGYYTSQENALARPALTPVVELMISHRNGTINDESLNIALAQLGQQDLRAQTEKYMYQTSLRQQYHAMVSSSQTQQSWQLSFGYDRNSDELDARLNRYTFKANHQLKLSNAVSWVNTLTFNSSETASGKTGIGEMTSGSGKLPPYIHIADLEGNPLSVMRNNRVSAVSGLANGQLLDWNYYPLTDYKYNNSTMHTTENIFNSTLSLKPLKNFSAELLYQFLNQRATRKNINKLESYFTRNLINTYTQVEQGNIRMIVPLGDVYNGSNEQVNSHQLRAQFHYDPTWKKHQLNIFGGAELRHRSTSSESFTNYGYNSQTLTHTNVDFSNTYPSIVNGARSFIPNNIGFGGGINRFVSLFTNLAYTFDRRYTINGSIRRDASNLFGVSTNRKWNPFWSVGLAWHLSEESFYKSEVFPMLKLRATYGYSGNTDPRIAAVTTLVYGASSPYTLMPSAGFSNYANPELAWEKVKTSNIGLDFASKSNWIRGSIEVYRKNADNLYGLAELDYTTGVGITVLKNVASMQASGIDIELGSRIKLGSLLWQPSLMLNYYSDEVKNYYLTSVNGSAFVNGNLNISGVVGRPVYSMFSYKWLGLDGTNGDPQGMVNNQLSKNYSSITGAGTKLEDLVYHGPLYAPWSGAMGNTFALGDFSLSFRLFFKKGNLIRKETINYGSLYSARNGHSDFENRWQQAGDEKLTSVPSMVYPAVTSRDNFYAKSEATILKGDFLSLQYINIGYDLPKNICSKLKVKTIHFYGAANNLGLLYTANKMGVHPEYPNTLTPPQLYSLGIKTSF